MNTQSNRSHRDNQAYSTLNNPQIVRKLNKETSPQLFTKLQSNQNIGKLHGNQNICFISPKKIAYFQKIDQSCLGASEMKMIQQQSNGRDETTLKLALTQKSRQIDYKSIKRCLSPRTAYNSSEAGGVSIKSGDVVKINKYIEQQGAEHAEVQFCRKLINDLKQQVLQMSSIIQAKDQQIKDRDLRILQLEREACKEQVSEINIQSLKQLSTNFEERSSRLLQSFLYFNQDDKSDKIAQMEETLRLYECRIRKQQIQIDIMKKNRFDRVQMQADLQSLTKKHSSLKRKVDKLTEKNIKLTKQLQRMKSQMSINNQKSLILQYSPQKPSSLS